MNTDLPPNPFHSVILAVLQTCADGRNFFGVGCLTTLGAMEDIEADMLAILSEHKFASEIPFTLEVLRARLAGVTDPMLIGEIARPLFIQVAQSYAWSRDIDRELFIMTVEELTEATKLGST